VRVATHDDLDGAAETLTLAFEADPLWSWAFPDPQTLNAWWRFNLEGALRYPCVWVTDEYAAVSVWIPPGGDELSEAQEAAVEPLLASLVGARAEELQTLLHRFEGAHPSGPPHYYLSLLGTHPNHRGRGLGMALLAENLARIDEESMPAYLESSNPGNDPRYERHGFERVGGFNRPDEQLTVSTMWRGPGGSTHPGNGD
jgi:GNAT superfamily N-acetyltransferase